MNYNDLLKKRFICLIVIGAILIFLITFMVYTPALKNGFVWDDSQYVCENTNIQSLNVKSLYWMLTSFYRANWHPLTWFSHAIDYAFWGLDPFGHHLTNIIIHGLNTLLVFLLVIQLVLRTKEVTGMPLTYKIPLLNSTKSMIVASVTALLFGLHPLRVESVAWISERKDLLCAFFFLLSILSYLAYNSTIVKRHRWVCFTACFLLFIFALMSKPMAVTLPLTLLLLDIYPLKRIGFYPGKTGKNLSLLLEKIPFFTLSIASSIITILAQHAGGAIKTFEQLALTTRVLNALRSLMLYLGKIFFPVNLIPFYPFSVVPHSEYLLYGVLVLTITGLCVWMARKKNYVWLVFWCYYLVTLLPVLGIIQVGGQMAADRYTYLPSLGPFLLVGVVFAWVWRRASLTRFAQTLRCSVLLCILLVVLVCGFLTVQQIKVWQNPENLWGRVNGVFPGVVQEGYYNLGVYYSDQGRADEAISQYKKALKINPNYAEAHTNLGLAYGKKGRLDEAISEHKNALAINPNLTESHINLGLAYGKKGRLDEAISEYKKVLTIKPNHVNAHYNLGVVYSNKGMLDEAVSEYKKTLAINPNDAEAHNNLGLVYGKKGRLDEAISEYKKALAINPNLAEARHNLGLFYDKKGLLDEAVSEYKKILAINPKNADTHHKLGLVYGKKGMLEEAIRQFKQTISVKPNYANAYNNLAWIYATSTNAALRNGEKAVSLATKACELTKFKSVSLLNTLAAAYAEAGNFKKAIESQNKAIDLSQKEGKPALLKRLELYQSGKPYRSR